MTNTIITITPGHQVNGTNPVTGRGKRAHGTGRVVRTETGGFHGLTTVVLWTNGVESYHSANLDNSCVQGL